MESEEDSLAIIGDTSCSSRIFKFEELKKSKEIICFDHHQNDIDFKASIFWHEPGYPASALQLFEIIDFLKVELNEEIAFNMLIGIMTDTGNFTYSLSNQKAPLYFSNLLKHVKNEKMDDFWKSFKRRTVSDIEAIKTIMNGLIFEKNIAYCYIEEEKTKKENINFKKFINSIGNIEDHDIWAIFVKKEGFLRVYLRSNGPDVSQVAKKFNGGGHKRASGIKIGFEKGIVLKIINELKKIG